MAEESAIYRLIRRLRRAFGPSPAEPARQAAALAWRHRKNKAEVLLVTSRGTGRWILPKGWIEEGETTAETARREAWEEAGIKGDVAPDTPIGVYEYDKLAADGSVTPVRVAVHALAVTRQARDWPERGERDRQWFDCHTALEQVDEPGLKTILGDFATDWKKLAA